MTHRVFLMTDVQDRRRAAHGSSRSFGANFRTGLVGIVFGAGLGLAIALVLAFVGARELIASVPLRGLVAGGIGGLAGCCVGLFGRVAARFERLRSVRVVSLTTVDGKSY
jgi:hypothetical protein